MASPSLNAQSLKSIARSVLSAVAPRTLVKRHLSGAGDSELELSLLDLLVTPGKTAIDVGANWGLYATALAKLCPSVVCLEPNPALVKILKRTLPPQCHVEHAAAARDRGFATLHIPMDGDREVDGLASLQNHGDRTAREVTVPTIPLDSFADRPVGFVKIDVEGAEMAVLGGMVQLINRQSPTVLIEIEERHRAGAIAEARAWFERRHYDGFYVFDGALQQISSFDVTRLQNYTRFDPLAERRTQAYVNNFIFAPKGRIGHAMKRAIAARLTTR
jgi:FkbM family methyltransferase